MKKSLTLFLSLLFVGMLYSQDNEPPQLSLFQESEEPAPQWILDFVKNDGASLTSILNDMFPDVEETKVQEFVEGNVGSLKDIVFEGKIHNIDEINTYLDNIKDKILTDAPELKEQVHIYLKESSSVNAVSYPNGLVLINTGLIAQLDSEDELAFVIGHEITHIAEQHSFDGFKDKKTYYKRYRGMSHQDVKDKIDSTFLYSRKQEFEADRNAISYVQAGGYNPAAAQSVMEKLYYNKVPYYNIPFDIEFLNIGDMVFSDWYFKNEIDSLPEIIEGSDRYHSHPGIISRIDNVKENYADSLAFEILGNASNSDAFFYKLREYTRLKNLNLLLIGKNYTRCIYESYYLLQEYPDSKYLKRFIPVSLYSLARFKNSDAYRAVAESYNEIPLESQQLHYFLRKLNRLELSLLAWYHMEDFENTYGEDEIIDMLMDDLLDDLIVTIDAESYMHKTFEGCIDSESELEKILANEDLSERLEELREKRERLKDKSSNAYKDYKNELKRKNYLVKNGLGLKPDRITFLDPYYLCYTQLNTSGVDVERSEKLTKQLYRSFGNKCDDEDVPYRVLDFGNTIQSDEYSNQLNAINKWFYELLNQGVYMPVSLVFEDSNLEKEKYETDIVVKIDIVWAKFLNRSYYRFVAVDLATGEKLYSNTEVLRNYMSFSKLEGYMIDDLSIITR